MVYIGAYLQSDSLMSYFIYFSILGFGGKEVEV